MRKGKQQTGIWVDVADLNVLGGPTGASRAVAAMAAMFCKQHCPLDKWSREAIEFLRESVGVQDTATWDGQQLAQCVSDAHNLAGLGEQYFGNDADGRVATIMEHVSAWQHDEVQGVLHAIWWAWKHLDVVGSGAAWWTVAVRTKTTRKRKNAKKKGL